MVPRNELPKPRQEFLSEEAAVGPEYNVQISLKTKAEMSAGAALVAHEWAGQCVESGMFMLRNRYHDKFVFKAEVIKIGWRHWDIILSVYETPINPSCLPKLIFEAREPADQFVSEFMLTKIIMVCG